MRVLLDTNGFVSSLLRFGSPHAILESLRDGAFTLITSEPLVSELIQVLGRSKFADRISPEDRHTLLELIRRDGCFVLPKRSTTPVRDPNDRHVLDCLYAADVLVSGDRDLQVLKWVGTTVILSPAAFLAQLKRS